MKTEFSDGRIGIRPYRPEDVPLLFEAARESISELSKWLPWGHIHYSTEDSAAFVSSRAAEWEKGEHYSFVIYDSKDGAFLGGVGLNFVNRIHKFANVGYWVRTSRTGRGVASASTRLVAGFALGELGFQRLEIVAATGNTGSIRAAEKAGATREGVLRKRLFLNGTALDAVMFSFVSGDFVA